MNLHPTRSPDRRSTVERRVLRWTLLIGMAAGCPAAIFISLRAGAGVWIGALLAWLNARWLRQAANGLVRVATAQAGSEKPRISRWVYTKLFLRYGLMAVILYVMVTGFDVPIMSMLAGLCSLAAAAMGVVLYELIVPSD